VLEVRSAKDIEENLEQKDLLLKSGACFHYIQGKWGRGTCEVITTMQLLGKASL
jgi:hypothetical protein